MKGVGKHIHRLNFNEIIMRHHASHISCQGGRVTRNIHDFSGTHGQYHRPEDDVWLLNVPGMVNIGDLAIAVVTDLLVRPDRPTFVR